MMTYNRVIPRDLFNEANLLKCLGRLWICLDERRDHKARLDHNGAAFRIEQSPSDDMSDTNAEIARTVWG